MVKGVLLLRLGTHAYALGTRCRDACLAACKISCQIYGCATATSVSMCRTHTLLQLPLAERPDPQDDLRHQYSKFQHTPQFRDAEFQAVRALLTLMLSASAAVGLKGGRLRLPASTETERGCCGLRRSSFLDGEVGRGGDSVQRTPVKSSWWEDVHK